jgi:hypothetical protein
LPIVEKYQLPVPEPRDAVPKYLELAHGVGQSLGASGARDETNRDLRQTEAAISSGKDEVAL